LRLIAAGLPIEASPARQFSDSQTTLEPVKLGAVWPGFQSII
jgi:hypothetical protein